MNVGACPDVSLVGNCALQGCSFRKVLASDLAVAKSATEKQSALRHTAANSSSGFAFPFMLPISPSDDARWGSFYRNSRLASFVESTRSDAALHLSPIPPFNAADAEGSGSQVSVAALTHKQKWLKHRQSLGVYQQRHAILAAIRDARIVTLVGENGSGKTMQLVQIISETDLCRRKRIILVVSCPFMALGVAGRLQEEVGSLISVAPVTPVQYSATSGTRIVVTTAAMLCRAMLSDQHLVDVACVIVDDVDHRSPDTDLLLLLLSEHHFSHHASAQASTLRLVATAATSSTEASLFEYLSRWGAESATVMGLAKKEAIRIERISLPSISVVAPTTQSTLHLEQAVDWVCDARESDAVQLLHGKLFDRLLKSDVRTDVEYMTLLQRLSDAEWCNLSVEDSAPQQVGTARATAAWCEHWPAFLHRLVMVYHRAATNSEAIEPLCPKNSIVPAKRAAVLILLPTIGHIQATMAFFKSRQEEEVVEDALAVELQLEVFHESMGLSQSDVQRGFRIFAPSECRRVIFASGFAAEVGLNIPYIGLVLDSAREALQTFDASVGCSRTSVEFLSRVRLTQRRQLAASDSRQFHGALATSVVCHLVPKAELQRKMTTSAVPSPLLHIDNPTELVLQYLAHLNSLLHVASTQYPKFLSTHLWAGDQTAQMLGEIIKQCIVSARPRLAAAGLLASNSSSPRASLELTPLGYALAHLALPLPHAI